MSKKKQVKNDDFLAQEAKEDLKNANDYTLDIPDDEIWSYQIEGLQKPHINKPFNNAARNKILVVIALVIAIGFSIFFSVRAVHSDLYRYTELEDGTYRLEKFSNSGDIKDITIDYVVDLETGEKDLTKPISEIAPFAFNCDEILNSISFGKDVKSIDGKSIYSCWWVRNVFIDDENPYYCDLDGVIYSKDMTEVVFYPNDHDKYLRLKAGYAELDENGEIVSKLVDDEGNVMEELWGTTRAYNEAYFQRYNRDTRTYVIPSTVTKIGELAFAYSNIVDLYIPEGVKVMDNMAIFKNTVLINIYSYKADAPVTDTTYKAIDSMSNIYASLPDGLETIGTDCMYYLRGLNYMYIPATVKEIGHHALWDAVFEENDELKGISSIDVEADEAAFNENCSAGQQWRPQYDYMLFKKSVDLNYSSQRKSQYEYNLHRQYYWAVQWIINNTSEEVKNNSGYLVKDMNNDGTPEMVLREYNEQTKTATDTVLTFNYGYIEEYSGNAEYAGDTFSKLDDNTQLDTILSE